MLAPVSSGTQHLEIGIAHTRFNGQDLTVDDWLVGEGRCRRTDDWLLDSEASTGPGSDGVRGETRHRWTAKHVCIIRCPIRHTRHHN